MKILIVFYFICTAFMPPAFADYERNKAVPVEKVLFGQIVSVRNISEQELIEDQHNGWQVFGGALIGGVIGNQFGRGHGRDLATILGAVIGGSIANNNKQGSRVVTLRLVELMIKTEQGQEYMVIQDFDANMVFSSKDEVRMVYLANGFVRIDRQM
ncbi:MAG: outer membrane lipoprotein SlyB [Alteromonadaceae bacterium]|jgi:outer membrane lipoprotein SlyB